MKRKIYISGNELSLAEYLSDIDDPETYDNWLDPETQSGYNYRMTDTYEEYHSRVWQQRFLAVILRNSDSRVIGTVSLSPDYLEPDLAIRLYRPFRGQGYGTDAFALAMKYCFDAFSLNKIYAGCYEHNTISLRMLKKCGFVPYPEGNSYETHFITGLPVTQLSFVRFREGKNGQ